MRFIEFDLQRDLPVGVYRDKGGRFEVRTWDRRGRKKSHGRYSTVAEAIAALVVAG